MASFAYACILLNINFKQTLWCFKTHFHVAFLQWLQENITVNPPAPENVLKLFFQGNIYLLPTYTFLDPSGEGWIVLATNVLFIFY